MAIAIWNSEELATLKKHAEENIIPLKLIKMIISGESKFIPPKS